MEVDLSPKFAKKVNGGNGGYFSTWSPSELPMLSKGNIGAVKLSLLSNGFVLPHYADSSKVGYVLQGSGVAGIFLPESNEKVIAIKKGDALALPFGTVTWFYNKEDTELEVIFIGNTSKAHKSGEITAFHLAGTNAIFTGFSSEFLNRAWDLDENTVTALIQNQPGHDMERCMRNFLWTGSTQDKKLITVPWAKFIWKDYLPPTRSFVCWRAILNYLPTEDKLRRRGFHFPLRCSLCLVDCENHDHLFVEWKFANAIWQAISSLFGTKINHTGTLLSLVQQAIQCPFSSQVAVLWCSAIVQAVWVIWKLRNAAIFDGSPPNIHCALRMTWNSIKKSHFFRIL